MDRKKYDQNKEINLKTKINNRYTFENFIINKNNELAYNIALNLCNNYSNTYNPIFFFGDNGSGKTHLINAIKNKILQNNPKVKILKFSSENFIREFVISRKNNHKYNFENNFYDIDILIIEDIQFIIGKKSVEKELLSILDYLYNKKVQIILSSDIEPSKLSIDNLSLKNRLFNGLLIPISKIKVKKI